MNTSTTSSSSGEAMAVPKYYSNGRPRFDDNDPPVQADKSDDRYEWWHGEGDSPHAPEDLSSYFYEQDPWAIVARRECYRNLGGKPPNASKSHSCWQDAALIVLWMSREPCGAFSSKPWGEDLWDMQAWAAFCNWYFWLAPQARYELLQDISRGACHRWMPAVLHARKNVPPQVWNDKAYAPSMHFAFNILQAGDDPAHAAGDYEPMSVPPSISEWVSPCDVRQWGGAGGVMCLSDYPSTSSWPVKLPEGVQLPVPGLPVPCEPFPQCVVDSLPALTPPCSPMPSCLYDLAAGAAAVAPGAVVTRTAKGGTYLPAEGPAAPPTKASEPDDTWLWIAGGVGGALALAVVGLAVRAFSADRTV